jgi:hypothetical protein
MADKRDGKKAASMVSMKAASMAALTDKMWVALKVLRTAAASADG